MPTGHFGSLIEVAHATLTATMDENGGMSGKARLTFGGRSPVLAELAGPVSWLGL